MAGAVAGASVGRGRGSGIDVCTMANSIGRCGGSGTLPAIGSPGGKSSLAVSLDAGGWAAGANGSAMGDAEGDAMEALGVGLFAASLPGPMAGGAVVFGLGQIILPGATAGEVGLLATICVAFAGAGGGIFGAAGAGPASGWAGAACIGCAIAIFAAGARAAGICAAGG